MSTDTDSVEERKEAFMVFDKEFSNEWKAQFPIGKSFNPPLLLSSPSLGPLLFNPKPTTLANTLFSSPSLAPSLLYTPQLSLERFLQCSSLLPSTSYSVASLFGDNVLHDDATLSILTQNRLQLLHCPDQNISLAFFPTGSNHDQVGCLVIQVKDNNLKALGDQKGDVFLANHRLNQKIMRILVSPAGDFDSCSGNSSAGVVVGYLMVCAMYSVHLFCVKFDEQSKMPVFEFLGCKLFKSSLIVGASWSPHLPEECVVLLQSGALFLFDMESYYCKPQKFNASFKGNKLRVKWDDSFSSDESKWLDCQFSWHPRILIVGRSDAVFLVDFRLDECSITCLATIEMLGLYSPVEKEQFLSFSKVEYDQFRFVLASSTLLVLCDVRKPLMPLLCWAHDLHNLCYIDVFRLSDLRMQSTDDTFEWATDSGSCIILGSFWNSEFRLFCYGPSLPDTEGSTALGSSDIPVFAWELPSDLPFSCRECGCGTCLVKEEFSKDALHEWIDWQQKKEIILGFGILNRELSDLLSESDEFGGFTLIRLMSSGNLEAQRYCASWEFLENFHRDHRDPLLNFEHNLLYSVGDEEYKFVKKFKYIKLDYFTAYMNGNLAKVLDSNMKRPSNVLIGNDSSFDVDCHQILCEKLKVCGFGRFRSSPSIAVVFNDISLPTSLYEVALRQMWASLPMDLLQLAFSSYSEILQMPSDQHEVSLEFSVIPDLPQLPPFLLKLPSGRSSKWSHKVRPSDLPVGPVLPLATLLTFHEIRNGCPNSQQLDAFSAEAELGLCCSQVLQAAKGMAVLDSSCEPDDDQVEEALSLADDRVDVWNDSEKSPPFFLHHPHISRFSAVDHTMGSSVGEDARFATCISKLQKKDVPSESNDTVGLELLDDLCPIELKFNVDAQLETKELEELKFFKSAFSSWQKRFTPYKELCNRSKVWKQDA